MRARSAHPLLTKKPDTPIKMARQADYQNTSPWQSIPRAVDKAEPARQQSSVGDVGHLSLIGALVQGDSEVGS
jgi:hypothetical protein